MIGKEPVYKSHGILKRFNIIFIVTLLVEIGILTLT